VRISFWGRLLPQGIYDEITPNGDKRQLSGHAPQESSRTETAAQEHDSADAAASAGQEADIHAGGKAQLLPLPYEYVYGFLPASRRAELLAAVGRDGGLSTISLAFVYI
jgi:hypothetical protein